MVARRQTSRRYSLCLVRCLWRAFSRMPRGCSARATASSCSGSCSHHQPLCISARQHHTAQLGGTGTPSPRPRVAELAPKPKGFPWGEARPRLGLGAGTSSMALTRGHGLLRQLGQVLLLDLLEELGGRPPSALGLPRHVLELLQAAPAPGAGAVGLGAGVDRGGSEQGRRGVISGEPVQLEGTEPIRQGDSPAPAPRLPTPAPLGPLPVPQPLRSAPGTHLPGRGLGLLAPGLAAGLRGGARRGLG